MKDKWITLTTNNHILYEEYSHSGRITEQKGIANYLSWASTSVLYIVRGDTCVVDVYRKEK